jgi:NAD(P)-dependent dehydrogenase (short-subunit alcohol dehydrogenase family)
MGAKLVITGRNAERLNDVFTQLVGLSHTQIVIDLEQENAPQLLLDHVDKLDGIVHSAGIVFSVPFKFLSVDKLSQIMRVNFEIPYVLTQGIIKSKKIQKNASLIFVSSVAYNTGLIGNSAYSASTGAISAMIKSIALELATQKIRVNAVCPGMVETNLIKEISSVSLEQLKADEQRNYPLGYGKPEDVAHSIVFLLSDASSWITGTNLVIDGGFSIH